MSTRLFIQRSQIFRRLLHPTYKRTIIELSRTMSNMSADDFDILDKEGQGLLTILAKNPKRFQRIKFLGKLYNSSGFELRIAGGAVRDILRGVEPQDIDFATTARPEQSLALLEKHEDLLRIIVTASGQKHGTVAVKFKEADLDFKKIKLTHSPDQQECKGDISKKKDDKPEYDEESPYEITTLRCDFFTDGRHAEVKFINDWRQDAERRDLTINAMFLTLDDGKLIDYFGGESDLKNGIVKFVGDADLRIREDYLRILRFFRFWSRYGSHNEPDSDTMKTLKVNLEGLDKISGERIWIEVKKTFSTLPCYEVVKLMLKLGLFDYIGLKETGDIDLDGYRDTVLQELQLAQDNVKHYLEIYEKQNNPEQTRVVSKKMKDLMPTILFSTVVRTTDACLSAYKRMKFSNIERDTINYIIDNRTIVPTIDKLKYQLAITHSPERTQVLQKMRALLIYKGSFDSLRTLDTWQVPNFPMQGHVVSREMKKRKLPGNLIKTVIESLKIDWATSDYKLTLEELLQKMTIKLDDLSKNKSV